jgi:hypothetical protein
VLGVLSCPSSLAVSPDTAHLHFICRCQSTFPLTSRRSEACACNAQTSERHKPSIHHQICAGDESAGLVAGEPADRLRHVGRHAESRTGRPCVRVLCNRPQGIFDYLAWCDRVARHPASTRRLYTSMSAIRIEQCPSTCCPLKGHRNGVLMAACLNASHVM